MRLTHLWWPGISGRGTETSKFGFNLTLQFESASKPAHLGSHQRFPVSVGNNNMFFKKKKELQCSHRSAESTQFFLWVHAQSSYA